MAADALQWHGRDGAAWAAELGVPLVEVHDAIDSTNDRAHGLAQLGAPAGTVVLADRQRAGRGQHGRRWASEPGGGIWCSVLERPTDASAVPVLALRVGLALAERLAPLAAPAPITLKWPNDVFLADGKLAGVLIEARWQDALPSSVVIGVGLNLRVPEGQTTAAALGTQHAVAALQAVVTGVRQAAAARGLLTAAERTAWGARDRAVGRAIVAPATGIVEGIAADGALQVRHGDGIATFHAGSLVFA